MITYRFAFLFSILTILHVAPEVNAEPQWMTLPPTPVLPNADRSGYAPINGIKIWYAMFGRSEPVILLHGGLINSRENTLFMADQIPGAGLLLQPAVSHFSFLQIPNSPTATSCISCSTSTCKNENAWARCESR